MLLWFTVMVTCWSRAVSLTYNSTKAILTDRYGGGRYHKEVVPMLDQTKAIQVNVSFELVSLVEVDDVAQRFTCNGFLMFQWVDEMAAWDPSDYGNQTMVHPLPETIWRPRVILMNTMGVRDLFQDDKAPVFVQSDGSTLWAPGSLFPASCQLKMENYPFDQHSCVIQLVAMTLSTRELEFVATNDAVGEMFFILNGEWDLKSSKVEISRFNSGPVNMSSIDMTITIKRRPFYLLINIVLPVVFLSFLNLLVFVIPVESGEKIGFGITVLLALSMSMSLISGMLPKSSLTIPKLTIYLFVLLIISLLTVVDNVIIAFMYHKQENEFLKSEKEKLTRANHPPSQQTKSSINTQSITLESLPRVTSSESLHSDYGYPEFSSAASSRRYNCVGRHIDSVSFISFFLIWVVVTAYYFVDLTSH